MITDSLYIEVWGQVARSQVCPWEHPVEWLHDRARIEIDKGTPDGEALTWGFAVSPAEVWAACTDAPCPPDVGRWLRLRNGRRTFDEQEQEERERVEAYRAKVRRQWEDESRRDHNGDRLLRRALAKDEEARRRVGVALGGKASGTIVRGVSCPSCRRSDVWFDVRGGWAHCNHKESCGWSSSLYLLAMSRGETL